MVCNIFDLTVGAVVTSRQRTRKKQLDSCKGLELRPFCSFKSDLESFWMKRYVTRLKAQHFWNLAAFFEFSKLVIKFSDILI
jgi:hypothetical protein